MVLVVAKKNVVARFVRLDEAVLEHECLALGIGDDDVDVNNSLDEAVEPRALDPRHLEVRAHPASKRAGFADIEDLPTLSTEQVDARAFGELVELFLEVHF